VGLAVGFFAAISFAGFLPAIGNQNVAAGSKADLDARNGEVRFSRVNGHRQVDQSGLKSAMNGLSCAAANNSSIR
jgi:hypothetical protein